MKITNKCKGVKGVKGVESSIKQKQKGGKAVDIRIPERPEWRGKQGDRQNEKIVKIKNASKHEIVDGGRNYEWNC